MEKYLIRRSASGLIGAAFLALALNQGRHGLLSPFIFYFLLSGFPILLPTLWRNCGWLGPVRQRFLTAQNEVWLTLDDGPNPHETPEILDVLSEHQAKATFFVVGKNVARWPHLARMIVERGHSIQNHTFHHRSATFWGVGTVAPLIPGFDGKGLLLASWTPSAKTDAPTFVIAHGGGGMDASLFVLGVDLRAMGDANILILDSIWSRGRTTNGGDSLKASGKTLSSNARMFDLVAAGRWLSTQGVDPKKTFAVGFSQGGWGVLRAFTNDPIVTELVKPLYAGGVSVTPPCEEP